MYDKNYNKKRVSLKNRLENMRGKSGLYPLKKAFYIYIFPIYVSFLFKNRKFHFKNKKINYFHHSYNSTWANERAIEIPLIQNFLKGEQGRILEVGNVLSHYMEINWDVLDKYENSEFVINEDLVNFKPSKKYKKIISISTLEHVGFDELPKDNTKILKAIENLKSNCLMKGGSFIFTVPIGWNPDLDILLEKRKICFVMADALVEYSKENFN